MSSLCYVVLSSKEDFDGIQNPSLLSPQVNVRVHMEWPFQQTCICSICNSNRPHSSCTAQLGLFWTSRHPLHNILAPHSSTLCYEKVIYPTLLNLLNPNIVLRWKTHVFLIYFINITSTLWAYAKRLCVAQSRRVWMWYFRRSKYLQGPWTLLQGPPRSLTLCT